MKDFTIYIATSWKNQHAVELLTDYLETYFVNVEVKSFVRNANEEPLKATVIEDITAWIWSERGKSSFDYDTYWAGNSNLIIAISPLGKDSSVEIGIAYNNKKPVVLLYSKGEDLGLMRRCFSEVFNDYKLLISYLTENYPVAKRN